MYKTLLLPPGLILVVALAALVLLRQRPRAVWWTGFTALAAVYALSTPIVGDILMSRLEVFPPLAGNSLPGAGPQAIVVLSADEDSGIEYGGPTVGGLTLLRLRYGVQLHRRTDLPVLVSGGRYPNSTVSLAETMRRVMHEEYGIDDVWVEDRSSNTWENAVYSAAILRSKGIDRIYLVTHAWHMARASKSFRRAGMTVVPAPTGFAANKTVTIGSFLPSAKAQLTSFYALHELIGGIAYDIMHGRG